MRRGWTADRLAGRARGGDPEQIEPGEAEDAAVPRRRLAVLCCMDARLRPEALLGLAPGDAHVVRNAGARLTPDAIRSLATSQRVLGTRGIVVLGHTDCRSLTHPGDPGAAVAAVVAALRTSPALAHRAGVEGLVADLATGLLVPAGADGVRRPYRPLARG